MEKKTRVQNEPRENQINEREQPDRTQKAKNLRTTIRNEFESETTELWLPDDEGSSRI